MLLATIFAFLITFSLYYLGFSDWLTISIFFTSATYTSSILASFFFLGDEDFFLGLRFSFGFSCSF